MASTVPYCSTVNLSIITDKSLNNFFSTHILLLYPDPPPSKTGKSRNEGIVGVGIRLRVVLEVRNTLISLAVGFINLSTTPFSRYSCLHYCGYITLHTNV